MIINKPLTVIVDITRGISSTLYLCVSQDLLEKVHFEGENKTKANHFTKNRLIEQRNLVYIMKR